MAIRDLLDMYALSPRAYILGKSPMAMLQILHIHIIKYVVLNSRGQKGNVWPP